MVRPFLPAPGLCTNPPKILRQNLENFSETPDILSASRVRGTVRHLTPGHPDSPPPPHPPPRLAPVTAGQLLYAHEERLLGAAALRNAALCVQRAKAYAKLLVELQDVAHPAVGLGLRPIPSPLTSFDSMRSCR